MNTTKKFAIALMLLSLAGSEAFAQHTTLRSDSRSGWVEVKKKKAPKPKKEKKQRTEFSRKEGLVFRPEIGAGIYLYRNDNAHLDAQGFGGSLLLNVNYQFNHSLAAGIGLGYQMAYVPYSYPHYDLNSTDHRSNTDKLSDAVAGLPLYLDVRAYLGENEWQPWVEVKLGGIIGLGSSTVDITRRYTSIGDAHPQTLPDGTVASYVSDTYDQYDDAASQSGFYGAIGLGFSHRNFSFGIEANLVNWVYNTDKTSRTEIRRNGMPQWEYDQTVAQYNTATPLSSSGNYSHSYTMLSFKLAYSIPTKVKLPIKIPFLSDEEE